jgi:hypothetical protein
MVAPIHPTPDGLLARVAELRAGGSSWGVVARDLGTTADEVRRAAESAGPTYRKLRSRAGRDVLDDAFAEALFAARVDLRSEDDKLRQRAYQVIFATCNGLYRHRDRVRVVKPKPGDIKLEDLPEDW